ncbi:DNA cytosine methyltransferase [Halobacillus salinus]|uniref:DNA (cytosine-5-)-methyltransferase n=1 Tax=Halobacillus salinus TaxID=192814 RepID=A0A4Z0GZ93_9BACI|nr:DNA cytosine methyltransferase [Halobacillus salinus]TGB03508.1 DNA cytosine methyltransferase [Halobacillus salinus]
MKTLLKNYNDNKGESSLGNYHVLDLFSGCGGLALGFNQSGFSIYESVELDEAASKTASYNLHVKENNNTHAANLSVLDYFYKPELTGGKVVTIGGPPCQAYSNIGKAKIRSLGEDRFGINDDRAFLYEEFLRVALEASSDFIVMENVPEAVNFLGVNIAQEVCRELEKQGYQVLWTILNAADYGVPQIRERLFVFAMKNELGGKIVLPEPTHQRPDHTFNTPNERRFKRFKEDCYFREPRTPVKDLPEWVTTHEALSDLPELLIDSGSTYQYFKPNIRLPYLTEARNAYQKKMRRNTWNASFVSGNSYRNTGRDFKIFEEMNWGDDYRHAHEISQEIFRKEAKRLKLTKSGHPKAYHELYQKIVPPYNKDKFFTKWKRLSPYKPSHTLVAHLGTDTYSHIHPYEPRGISIREAARLQSFPDDFLFQGGMGDSFKQIGNAVPPLLSEAISKAVIKSLSIGG